MSDAIAFYLREVAPRHKAAATTAFASDRLLEWWHGKTLGDIRSSTCRAYAEYRMAQSIPSARTPKARLRRITSGTVARELTVLRAAVAAYHAEHRLDAVPVVTLPQTGPARDRWLTRDEAARFLRAARRHPDANARRALIRFFLLAVYTGSRSGAIRKLGWMANTRGGWVDLEADVMHRRSSVDRESKKRQPPVRIPVRLLRSLRAWRKADGKIARVVHYAGQPIISQRRAWNWARDAAGLGKDVIPHILRHTAVTWAMQRGEDGWQVAGYFGMSPEVLWRVYGHHHPDFQVGLAARIGRSR